MSVMFHLMSYSPPGVHSPFLEGSCNFIKGRIEDVTAFCKLLEEKLTVFMFSTTLTPKLCVQ